jgi:hypothetical protein
MATLLGTTPENVLIHLKNVDAEREVGQRLTAKDFLAVRAEDGGARLADNAMVALPLLMADSGPAQKDLMIRLILNLLEDDRG